MMFPEKFYIKNSFTKFMFCLETFILDISKYFRLLRRNNEIKIHKYLMNNWRDDWRSIIDKETQTLLAVVAGSIFGVGLDLIGVGVVVIVVELTWSQHFTSCSFLLQIFFLIVSVALTRTGEVLLNMPLITRLSNLLSEVHCWKGMQGQFSESNRPKAWK